jgi:phosphoglycolate phosphatase
MPCHAGVIWKGDKLIDGVPETLDMLHAMGKRLVFVTNNSTKSRKQYAKKFDSLGLNVAEEEIFASSFAAAAYLKSVNFPSNKKVAGLFSAWSKHLLKLQNSSAHFK